MATPVSDFSRMKFLIVDDFPNFCGAMRAMAASFGVEDIDMTLHGEDAIRALNKKRYDVVLCDYRDTSSGDMWTKVGLGMSDSGA